MALVDYPSSDDEDKNEDETAVASAPPNLKRKRDIESANELPPLPSKFHDLYASTTRVSTKDDPSMHGGRKRVTPHVDGNWPTHLYIEWYPATAEYASLSKLISNLKDGLPSREASEIHSFLTSDLGTPLPLHISLSRPIGFNTDHKDDFVATLEASIKSSGIRPFDVNFFNFDWVANFEKTRWFLVLRVQQPKSNGLNKLLHVCNSVVQRYDQPPLYAKPSMANSAKHAAGTQKPTKRKMSDAESSKAPYNGLQDVSDAFHISIAWTPGSPSQEILEMTKSTATDHHDSFTQLQLMIYEIKAKVGNVVTNVPLHTNVQENKGLFGL